MELVLPLLIAFIGGGGLATFLTSFCVRKKTSAEATEVLVKTALSLLTEARAELITARAEIDELKPRVELLEKENAELRCELDALRRFGA